MHDARRHDENPGSLLYEGYADHSGTQLFPILMEYDHDDGEEFCVQVINAHLEANVDFHIFSCARHRAGSG